MDFEINIGQIMSFESLREFMIWFDTMDDYIEFENVDELLNELAVMDKPDFYMYVYDFKQQFLKDENND
jgi:hypothetical protein